MGQIIEDVTDCHTSDDTLGRCSWKNQMNDLIDDESKRSSRQRRKNQAILVHRILLIRTNSNKSFQNKRFESKQRFN